MALSSTLFAHLPLIPGRQCFEPLSSTPLVNKLPLSLPSPTLRIPYRSGSFVCRAAPMPAPERPAQASKPRVRPNPKFGRQAPPASSRNPQSGRKPKLFPEETFDASLDSVPAIGWITPVSMPRRRRGPSVPERWPNEEEMEQHGWDTDHDFPEPPRKGSRSSPVLHGRGMNTPKLRVRASPSAQEGSYKSAAPVEFQGTGDIVEDVIRALRRRPAAPEAVRDVMGVYGVHMGKYDVIATVTALQKRHDWRRCSHMFCWMKKQAWHRPNLRFYTGMMNFLGKHGQAELVTLLFQEILLEKLQPDNYTFTALINCYGRVQMFSEALAVFNHMKTETGPCRPNTVTCNALIGALCRGGEYSRALEIFSDMKTGANGLKGCKPNGVTSNILISALCKAGCIEEAEAILRNMGDPKRDPLGAPNVVTYNTLMDACAKNGMTRKAEAFFAEMRERGFVADVITYTAMIDAYGKEGLCEEAERMFQEMQSAGCKADSWAFTALIDAYGKGGQPGLAESAFGKMTSQGLEPTDVTFLALIDAFAKAGRCAEAGVWFSRMKKAGFKPTALHYSALMDGYGRGGKYKEAAELFREMQRGGCAPTTVTYSALLTACSKCSTWEEALVLLYVLNESGKDVELAICRLVMGSPGEAGLWENAARLFRKVGGDNRAIRRSFFNALLDVLWAFGLKARANRVLTTARQSGAYLESDLCSFRDTCWELDLHSMGVGAAQTMVLQWLAEIRTALAWGAKIPAEVTIVTGWGKHTRAGASPVKVAVRQLLDNLGVPVRLVAGNGGRVTFTGSELLTWLRSAEGRDRLVMTDVVRPGPEQERRKERRELRFFAR
ncbi:putative Small MutS-related domain [Klebsormidium nitens]|uniref:Putative Small MutS-related domain n=1 Tax=Klebsormidium nitens TaxID=105231 RepID=A0A0U9HSG1_KLENI|nr:putative Small MutS-related domain [Klebsormidium nitens]|eukprot:GAQ81958.1 putative Small MutS-related domain [Klebsormidium nitens]